MTAVLETRAPRHVSNYHGGTSSPYSYSRRSRSSTGSLFERINAAEVRSVRPRSHSRSLVLAEPRHHHHHDHRSIDEINAEIAALEAESRANHLERKAERERELAEDIRDYSPPPPERIILDRHHHHHHHHRRSNEEIVLFEKDRPLDVVYDRRGRRSEEIFLERSRSRARDDYVVYERRRQSPERNVVRVEKDRKGRLALVRSSR